MYDLYIHYTYLPIRIKLANNELLSLKQKWVYSALAYTFLWMFTLFVIHVDAGKGTILAVYPPILYRGGGLSSSCTCIEKER
jgi:hypothetical protein